MALFDNLLTVGILLALAIIVYLRMTNRTIGDLFRDIRDVMQTDEEVIYQWIK